nr:hypothetical protein [Mycobacterium uberis]
MAIGLLLGGIFLQGGLVGKQTPGVSDSIARMLQFAAHGSFLVIALITVVNVIAEEMFSVARSTPHWGIISRCRF